MDIFDLIFPKRCLVCKKQGKYICDLCLSRVDRANPVCPFCKSFSINGNTHKSCLSKTSLDGAIAIWRYERVIKYAISRLKYNFNFDIANELSSLASDEILHSKLLTLNSVLVPIPIHSERQQWRGFNQSEVLAKNMAKILKLEYKNDLLVRTKLTTPQAKLDKKQRLRSIRGVFAVNPRTKHLLPNAQCLVFDDVWTTGATLNEAAKELKKAGARKVWGLTLAR